MHLSPYVPRDSSCSFCFILNRYIKQNFHMKLFLFLTTNSIYSSCHVLLVAKDSTIHSENPRYTSLTALFNSKLIYFGMQIRLENIDSLLTCLWRTGDAAGNSAYNRTCIMSITHSLRGGGGRSKEAFIAFALNFRVKKHCAYCLRPLLPKRNWDLLS